MLGGVGRGRRAIDAFWHRKLDESVAGNGLYQVGNTSGASSWIDQPPNYWNGRDFINAILLRGNVLPTKGGVHNPANERRCRAGCNRTESLSHVLQTCPITHYERIRRHDRVITLLGKAAKKSGWNFEFEPRFRDDRGVLQKPDLIATKNGRTIVGEVSINWEGPENLDRPFQGKMTQYSEAAFISCVQNKFPDTNISVHPFVIGARGGWCPKNKSLVEAFGMSNFDIKTIICDVLKGGWYCHKFFSMRVWE